MVLEEIAPVGSNRTVQRQKQEGQRDRKGEEATLEMNSSVWVSER